jgi:glycosyltransferase involved in cell wall biosynthesis
MMTGDDSQAPSAVEPGAGRAAARDRPGRPRLWLTWERHRRSRELSAALGTELHELIFDGPWSVRALALSIASTAVLLRRRPRILFVQNPSIILATVACLLRPLLGYRLIVDRHSNFFPDTVADPSFRFRVFHVLSRYTIRRADLTIVTNDPLKELLESWGGRGFVLPDRLPDLRLATPRSLGEGRAIVFVCSYAFDEPLAEVLQAAARLAPDCRVYVTGDSRRSDPRLVRGAPPNVTFTGFLSEGEDQSLLASADVVLALTELPDTLLCCAYEAVALGKPLVLSNHEALVRYFRLGAVFTEHAPEAMAASIMRALAEGPRLRAETAALVPELRTDWDARFRELLRRAGMDRTAPGRSA